MTSSNSLAVLVFCFIYFESSYCVQLGTLYTLYPGIHTWNEARNVCVTSGQRMLNFKTAEEKNLFMSIAQPWVNNGQLSTDIWTGLHDNNTYHNARVNYVWQGGCGEQAEYLPWSPGYFEPNEQNKDFCVRLCMNLGIKTKTCSDEYAVVCQAHEDTCWFVETEVYEYSQLSTTHTDTFDACKLLCLQMEECWAIFYSQSGACRMFKMSTNIMTVRTMFVKTCAAGSVAASVPPVKKDNSTIPVDGCNSPTSSSTLSTSTSSTSSDSSSSFSVASVASSVYSTILKSTAASSNLPWTGTVDAVETSARDFMSVNTSEPSASFDTVETSARHYISVNTDSPSGTFDAVETSARDFISVNTDQPSVTFNTVETSARDFISVNTDASSETFDVVETSAKDFISVNTGVPSIATVLTSLELSSYEVSSTQAVLSSLVSTLGSSDVGVTTTSLWPTSAKESNTPLGTTQTLTYPELIASSALSSAAVTSISLLSVATEALPPNLSSHLPTAIALSSNYVFNTAESKSASDTIQLMTCLVKSGTVCSSFSQVLTSAISPTQSSILLSSASHRLCLDKLDCTRVCLGRNWPNTSGNMSLLLDKKKLSSYHRSKQSMPDERITAVCCGASAIIVLSVGVICLVAIDCDRVVALGQRRRWNDI